MKSFISFIILISCAACITFGSNDVGINPGRIFWPKDTWFSNPIELSQTNAGSLVTMIFHIRPSTTLASASIDLIFTPAFSSSTKVTLSSTYSLTAGTDTSVTYAIALPSSSGIYGPFGIVTRSFSTGKIVDVNYNFGCVALTSSVVTRSLLASILSSITTINTDNTLKFEFSLTFSLWAYDIIEIVPDFNTGNLWVLKTGPICKSVGDSNILWGPDNNILPCSLGKKSSQYTGFAYMTDNNFSQDSIYIYGISSDAYVSSGSSYIIKIDVSSITSPPCVTSSSAWIVNIWRFGTNNLLAKYATSAGPGSTAGTASFSSWNSVNFPSNTVVVGQTLFTKLTVSTSNTLPEWSSLVITFSGIDIYNTVWWQDNEGTEFTPALCYVNSSTSGTVCAISDATTLTLSFSKIQAKGSFSVVLQTYFASSTAYVTKITSYYGLSTSTAVVDESEGNPGTFIIKANASPTHLISDLALHSLQPTTIYPQLTLATATIPSFLISVGHQYGGDKTQDIFIRVTPGSSNIWGGGSGHATTVALYFPRSTAFEFNSFGSVYIDSSLTKLEYISAVSIFGATDLSSRATINPITVSTSIANQIILSFNSFTDSLTSDKSYILRYSTPGKVSLPFIASNLGTFYEIWAVASYTVAATATIETGSAVFSVLPHPGSYNLFTKQACAAFLDGIPLVNYFAPINADFDFSVQSYAIDIVIDVGYHFTNGFLGTGIMAKSDNTGSLTYGTQFTSTTSTIPTATFKVSGSQVTLTLKGLGSTSVSSGTSVTTFFPNAVSTLGQIILIIDTYFYFTKSPDTSIRQILYQTKGYNQAIGTSSISAFDNAASIGVTAPASWYVGASSTVEITQGLQAAYVHDVSANSYIGVGLPRGYTFSSPIISSKIDAATEYTAAPLSFYIPSQDADHYGGFILGIKSSTTAWGGANSATSAVVYNLQVSNLIPPNYSGNDSINVWIVDAGSLGGACTYSNSYTSNPISALKLTTPTCVSDSGTIVGLSADSVNLTMIFGFTTTIKVLKGGSIWFTMDSSWIWPSTTSSYSSSSIKGTFAAGSYLIVTLVDDLKAGSYTITVTGVAPPTNTGLSALDKDCFTELTTTSALHNFIVESWSTIDEVGYQTVIHSSSA